MLQRLNFGVVVAVITGGSGGFGRAAAIGLAAYGADVVVTSRTLSSLEETVAEVEKQGAKALAISCDVTDADSVSAMAEQVVEQFLEFGIVELPDPFPRMSYAEAMRRYGSDKPDLRIQNLSH